MTPEEIKLWIGGFILTNLSLIGSAFVIAFKAVWWASRQEARIDALHTRQDNMEKEK